MGKNFSHEGRFLSGLALGGVPSLRICLNSVEEIVRQRTTRFFEDLGAGEQSREKGEQPEFSQGRGAHRLDPPQRRSRVRLWLHFPCFDSAERPRLVAPLRGGGGGGGSCERGFLPSAFPISRGGRDVRRGGFSWPVSSAVGIEGDSPGGGEVQKRGSNMVPGREGLEEENEEEEEEWTCWRALADLARRMGRQMRAVVSFAIGHPSDAPAAAAAATAAAAVVSLFSKEGRTSEEAGASGLGAPAPASSLFFSRSSSAPSCSRRWALRDVHRDWNFDWGGGEDRWSVIGRSQEEGREIAPSLELAQLLLPLLVQDEVDDLLQLFDLLVVPSVKGFGAIFQFLLFLLELVDLLR